MAGSLSDHLGRKPVIVAALAIQVMSMALFLTADGIGGLLAARIVQGLSMGVVNGALVRRCDRGGAAGPQGAR